MKEIKQQNPKLAIKNDTSDIEEIWKDIDWIEGFEGLYQVSNLGRVKSLDRIITFKDGRIRKFKGKILKQNHDKDGYLMVSLVKNGNYKYVKVHRLVGQAFIKNIYNKPYIDHIDTDKTNNVFYNLRWVTQKENVNNPITKQHAKNSRPKEKIKLRKKIFCNELNMEFDSLQEAVETLDLNYGHLSECLSGKRKKHKGYTWKFL